MQKVFGTAALDGKGILIVEKVKIKRKTLKKIECFFMIGNVGVWDKSAHLQTKWQKIKQNHDKLSYIYCQNVILSQ